MKYIQLDGLKRYLGMTFIVNEYTDKLIHYLQMSMQNHNIQND